MMPQWSSFSTIVPFSAFILMIQYVWVQVCGANNYVRDDFPADFVFGSGTSAYQVEGAAFEDGRTPSIWNTFVHSRITNEGNGDIACDTYHKYKEDVKLMAEMDLEAYRFSIDSSLMEGDQLTQRGYSIVTILSMNLSAMESSHMLHFFK